MPQVAKDQEWTSDGDMIADETGDVKEADQKQTVIQIVEFRGRTAHDDYEPDRFLGANLQSHYGKMGSREVGDALKEDMFYALTKDGLFEQGQLFVDAIPYGRNDVAVFAFVQDFIDDDEGGVQNLAPVAVGFAVRLEEGLITRITGVKE
jgi:hypothetical protein